MKGDVTQPRGIDTFDATDMAAVNGSSLLEALWRFRWLVLVTALLAGGAGYGLSFLQATTYEAEAGMILTDPRTAGVFDDGSTVIRDLSRYVRNQAEFAESADVAIRAIDHLPSDSTLTVEGITSAVSVTPSQNLDLVTIRATQPTATGAADLANAIGIAYQELVGEEVAKNANAAIDQLADSRDALRDRVDGLEGTLEAAPDNLAFQAERDAAIAQLVTLETRIEQINVNMALYGSGVQYFEEAEVPVSPATPKPLRNAALATVLGLLGSSALAWWRTERLPLAQDRHDPAPILEAPLLGEVPEFTWAKTEGPVPTIFEPTSAAAEAYQFIVSSLEFALGQIEGSTVLITSPGPAAGKTITALNLSVAALGDGTQLLLVDADERARGLTRMGGSDAALGLTDLAKREDLELLDCLQRWRVSDDEELNVIPTGSRVASAAGFFRSPEFRKLMTTLRSAAPLVVFDSAPVLAASEASDIAAQVDGIVLVIEQGTPLRALEETRSRIEMTGKPLLGYVFNRADHKYGRYGYGRYYGYGYGYGYGREE